MKFRLVYLLFLGALCSIVLLGNKNGRASDAKKGNTGAPGDETNTNGSPRICTYCHFGAAGPVVFVHVLDTNGDTVTQYLPGQQYTARVTIANSNPALTGYGFQMIALRDSGNVDLHGFSDPGNNTVNNYKLATIPNGRTYAEHDNVSVNNNKFEVMWTAPAAGTGPVTFYAAGNAVNRNGTTSGDGAASTVLHLPEAGASAVSEQAAEAVTLEVWPNPVQERAFVRILAKNSGVFQVRVIDLQGRVQWQTTQQLNAGENMLQIPAASWASGLYLLEVSNGTARTAVKLLR